MNKRAYDRAVEKTINYELREAYVVGWLSAKYEEQIKQFETEFPDRDLYVNNSGISVYTEDRDVLMSFLQIFGGKYEKELSYCMTKMNYSRSLRLTYGPGEFDYHPYSLSVNGCNPPPSCQIIEEEVIVPEQKKIVKRIKCTE